MKKFLLFIVTLFSVQLCFSETLTSSFVFDNMTTMSTYSWSPKALNTTRTDSYTDNTIINGEVSLYLGVRANRNSHGFTLDFDNNAVYPIGITGMQNALFVISVPSGYKLNSIQFTGNGLLTQESGTVGTSSLSGYLLAWNADGNTTNTASFFAGGASSTSAFVKKITAANIVDCS